MRKLLLTIIVLLPFAASAQKLQKPTIDKITNDTSWTTSKEKLYMHGNYLTGQGEAVLSFLKVAKDYKTLILNPQTTNQRAVFMITKGNKVYLKLSDNSTVTLVCATNDIGSANVGIAGNQVITSGNAFGLYDITAEDIAKLSTTNLTFLRIETSTGNFDCEIKPKNAEMFKKQFLLIANLK